MNFIDSSIFLNLILNIFFSHFVNLMELSALVEVLTLDLYFLIDGKFQPVHMHKHIRTCVGVVSSTGKAYMQ